MLRRTFRTAWASFTFGGLCAFGFFHFPKTRFQVLSLMGVGLFRGALI